MLSIHLAYNTGIAFGIPIEGVLLDVLTVSILVGLFVYAIFFDETRKNQLSRWGYVSLFAGSVSNGFDRLMHDRVVDFVDLKYFAIFNLADIVICVGALLLFVSHSQSKKTEK